jgi:ribosomal protein RSM22 (predicted rRNA methylase)
LPDRVYHAEIHIPTVTLYLGTGCKPGACGSANYGKDVTGSADEPPGTASASAGSLDAVHLAAAIQAGLSGAGIASLTAGVQRLMAAYRSGEVPDAPVMASRADAAAYAAYRMPATAAATAIALRETRLSLPGWAPATLLDFGAGTGGAAWAAARVLPSIQAMTLLEQSADAIRLGAAILGESSVDPLQSATWRQWRLADADVQAPELPVADGPAADLAAAAYVLGELTPAQQTALVTLAARSAPVVLLVEPGTPAGHRRILAARAQLLAAGYIVAAPCPHQLGCPLDVPGDWCHFAARLPRSALHRQVKGAELSHEDEKFSYVAAARPDTGRAELPAGRVVRRPQLRKGLVTLDLCACDGISRRELVSKSKGEAYRRARKTSWGDRWD